MRAKYPPFPNKKYPPSHSGGFCIDKKEIPNKLQASAQLLRMTNSVIPECIFKAGIHFLSDTRVHFYAFRSDSRVHFCGNRTLQNVRKILLQNAAKTEKKRDNVCTHRKRQVLLTWFRRIIFVFQKDYVELPHCIFLQFSFFIGHSSLHLEQLGESFFVQFVKFYKTKYGFRRKKQFSYAKTCHL